jgi:hypothetical protein
VGEEKDDTAVEPVPVIEKLEDEAHHDHGGDKMGNISNGLDGFLILPVRQGIEEQGKDDGDGKPDAEAVEGEGEGVGKNLDKLVGLQEAPEVIKAYPGTAKDSQVKVVPLKGDNQASHRPIVKHNKVGQGKNQEQIDLPAIPNALQEPGPSLVNC